MLMLVSSLASNLPLSQGSVVAEGAGVAASKTGAKGGVDRKWKLHQEMSIENVLKMQQQTPLQQEQEQEQQEQQEQHPKPQRPDTGTPYQASERSDKEPGPGQQDDTVQLRQRVAALQVRRG